MINETFFNDIYISDYSDDNLFESRLSKARKELNTIQFHNKNKALDLGAGPGVYSIILSDMGFNEVTAVDYSVSGHLKAAT